MNTHFFWGGEDLAGYRVSIKGRFFPIIMACLMQVKNGTGSQLRYRGKSLGFSGELERTK